MQRLLLYASLSLVRAARTSHSRRLERVVLAVWERLVRLLGRVVGLVFWVVVAAVVLVRGCCKGSELLRFWRGPVDGSFPGKDGLGVLLSVVNGALESL